jgi:murein DD-endopeptidase MepM/ murein hydrolase activator NlpD
MRQFPSIARLLPVLLLFAVGTLIGGCENRTTLADYRSGPPADATAKIPSSYAVRSGDTIYSIARQYNLSVRSLIDANNLQPPFQLTAGQVLVLGTGNEYVVVPNDTLLGIARKTGVPFSTLARMNELSAPYVVKVGQRLKLPSSATTAVADAGGDAPQPVAAPPPAVTSAALPPPVGAQKTNGGYTPLTDRANKPTTTTAAAAPAAGAAAPAVTSAAAPAPAPATTAAPSAAAAPAPAAPAAAAAPPAAASAATASPAASPAGDAPAEQRVAAVSPPPIPPPPPSSGKGGHGFIWPVKGQIIAEFGSTGKGQHNDGINIAAARGTPVRAAEDGTVVYAGNELRGFGNLLLIKHADGKTTAYAHNDSLLVKRGDTVRRGQEIAKVGDSGGVSQPQLHFEVRQGTRAVDPMTFLDGGASSTSFLGGQRDPG